MPSFLNSEVFESDVPHWFRLGFGGYPVDSMEDASKPKDTNQETKDTHNQQAVPANQAGF